ncbi:MAG: recombinase family protein [Dehalococcoidia bacterium]|nr:MAG: recombinase family protein [Dehalococcoidia bacterium]
MSIKQNEKDESNIIPVAALYRVSTTKQLKEDEEDSIPVQAAVARDFVSKHPGWLLTSDREYIEEGVSAYKVSKDDRDILQQVLADAMAGKFKILLVFKADRLSRKSFEYPLVLWQLHNLGVDVIAVADAPGGKLLKVEDQYDKLIRFVEGWQAETESKNTSIRVSNSMREHAKAGRWSGGRPPYGFKLSEIKNSLPLQIDEYEKSVLELICDLYEEGMGGKRVANELSERGYRTKMGRMWTGDRVRSVILNPIIAGLPAYGRTKPGNTPNSRVRITGFHDINNFIVPRDEKGNPKPIPEYSIISLNRWLRIIDRMQKNNSNRNRVQRDAPPARAMTSSSLLTGFLVCGYCGKGFVGTSTKNKKRLESGGMYVYKKKLYRCVTHAKVGGGDKICKGQANYSQKKIDEIFLRELEAFLSAINPKEFRNYVDQRQMDYLAGATTKLKGLESELKKNRKIYNEWVVRLDIYFANPEGSIYPEELLAAKVREYNNNCNCLEKEISSLKSGFNLVKYERDQLKMFSKKAPQWLKLFIEAPVASKKQMLSHIINKVYLHRDRIEIHYNVDIADFVGRGKDQDEYRIELKVLASF